MAVVSAEVTDWSQWTERRLWLVETMIVQMVTSVMSSLRLWLTESALCSLWLAVQMLMSVANSLGLWLTEPALWSLYLLYILLILKSSSS